MKRELRRTSAIAATLGLVFLGGGVTPVFAQDASERINELETQMRSMTKEIEDLKGKVDQTKDKSDATAQKLDSSVPTAVLGEGIGLTDPRGNWALRFNGRVQADYRTFDPNGISAGTFGLRRARIGVGLTAFKDYQMYVEGEFINGSATGPTVQNAALTNGWLEASWFPAAKLRMGQFKPQFGLENSMPDVLTDFQERGLTQSLLQNLNYDRGIMFHGSVWKGMYYGLTASNGTGLNLEESQNNTNEARTDGKDFTGRLVQNFAEFINTPDLVLHFGGSYKTGAVTTRATTGPPPTAGLFQAATVQTEGRGMTFFSPTAFSSIKTDRTISALEGAVVFGPVKLQSEWWQAKYEAAAPTKFERKLEAYYVSLGLMLTGESYADSYRNGAFGRLKPRNNFSMDNGGGWGAWEAAVRYSSFDGSDFKTSNAAGTGVLAAATSTNQAHAYTGQLKWLPNAYTRFLINYIYTSFETPVTQFGVTTDHEKAITLRGQLDF